MPELIVNADDFGLSPGVNSAVLEAWREGILTSASLMAAGDAFDDAVAIARENPALQVGLHLTLVQGRGVLPPEEIPGLVSSNGAFDDNPVRAGMRFYFLRDLRLQLKNEIEAQLRKVRDAGIALSHVDGHLNIHMQPVVFDLLMELAPSYGITSIRLTRERLAPSLRAHSGRRFGKALDAFIFSRLAERSLPALRRQKVQYADEVKGLLTSGRMTEQTVLALLQPPLPPLTEIYFHPGSMPCAEVSRRMPDYRHEQELQALKSPEVKRRLRELSVTLRNYRGDRKSDG